MSNNENEYGFGYGSQISGGVNYENTNGAENEQPPAQSPLAGSEADAQSERAKIDLTGQFSTPQGEPVLDISTDQFSAEVIQESANRPVLIDFWAPWCEPCKQMTPVLEAAVAKAGGRVKLVKMNIDDHPQIAGQMGIQSIPAVVAFVDGQPKDAFMGAKSASEIDQFIEKIAGPSGPSQLDLALEQGAQLMDEEAYNEAAQIYGSILSQVPDNLDAMAGFGTAALKLGNLEHAKSVLDGLPENTKHVGIQALQAAITLEEQAADIGDFAALEEEVANNPKDHEKRFDLAIALNGAGKREEAADHLLDIIAADRQWREDGAKAQLLQFFEAWGPMDAVTLDARRRLSSILFS